MRIAFLTPEFVTEMSNGGGLGNYLNRIARSLRDLGHEPEVFVSTKGSCGVIGYDGIRVERVGPARTLPLRLLLRLGHLWHPVRLSLLYLSLGQALGLARALERRHREAPFDFVQSANFRFAGLFVRRQQRRPHIVRLSSVGELLLRAVGRVRNLEQRIICHLERRCMRRADVVYAPSHFLADYVRDRFGIDAKVVRPPACIEVEPSVPPPGLPERYFIHFGKIGRLKGADVIANALPLVWEQAPDFAMVWAGALSGADSFEEYRSKWGDRASQVVWTGPVEKPVLYAMLRQAEAAVLPSRVDNLPNTVIESLLFGVPVIGTRGTSIEELVEPGRSGELVPIGDPAALADAMTSAWCRRVPWTNGGFRPPAVLREMDPKMTATAVVRLAGVGP